MFKRSQKTLNLPHGFYPLCPQCQRPPNFSVLAQVCEGLGLSVLDMAFGHLRHQSFNSLFTVFLTSMMPEISTKQLIEVDAAVLNAYRALRMALHKFEDVKLKNVRQPEPSVRKYATVLVWLNLSLESPPQNPLLVWRSHLL